MMYSTIAIIVVVVLSRCAARYAATVKPFPTSIERCAAGDTECLAELITRLMQTRAAGGMPELGVPPMDPLFFGRGTVSRQDSGPQSMNITISMGYIHGWQQLKVTKVVGFGKDPRTSKFELHVHVPVDRIAGQYNLESKVPLLPVKSSGAVNLTLENLDMVFKFRTEVVMNADDGEEYLRLKNIDLQAGAHVMYVYFENLFENPAFSDNDHELEYRQALLAEFQSSYNTGRSSMLLPILRPIFEKFPYRMWFADDAVSAPTDETATRTTPQMTMSTMTSDAE